MVGTKLLHYRILEKLGEGGMGAVYLATDERLDRRTALKILSPRFSEDPERLARFEREAKALASLNHPNIVTVYAVEEYRGIRFIAMELIEGRTLNEWILAEGLSLKRFFDVCLPLTAALSAAHDRGVTHRDLKPTNIMITRDGRVKILDFGLAKLLEDKRDPTMYASEELTGSGRIMGTVPYMSPEQLRGEPVDHRSDLFSFGILMYEMVMGESPFHGDTSIERASSILRDSPRPIDKLDADVPQQLARVIHLCLEKKPGDRVQSALGVHDQLQLLKREIETRDTVSGNRTLDGIALGRRTWGIPALRRSAAGKLLTTRAGLTALLGLVFVANWVETTLENWSGVAQGFRLRTAEGIASAMQWLERGISFENHDTMSPVAVFGTSLSYFVVFPLLLLAIAWALGRRPDIRPFRVFALALTAAYAISLPFFVLFPVPERWSYPESGAILLSDLWTSRLIEITRPISGLDNCFPSSHVALTVIAIVIGYRFGLRARTTVLALGSTVILATFVLGIHWIADIVAGVATGIIGVEVAERIDAALAGTARGSGSGNPVW